MPEAKNIRWQYGGKADYLVGSGATRAERGLTTLAGLLGAALYLYFYLQGSLDWNLWQYLLAALLAVDVAGGVIANSLNSCKRFYHSPPKPGEPRYGALLKNHFVFSASHIHPLVIAWVYGKGQADYLDGALWYVGLVAATACILKLPLYLRRPVSFLIILAALTANTYFITPIAGFQWFMPALYLKIVYGHLVQEEPYRPLARQALPK